MSTQARKSLRFFFKCVICRDFQIETHPYLQQKHLLRFAQNEGLHVTAFSPLGHGASYFQDSIGVMYEDVVKKIAKNHGRFKTLTIVYYLHSLI